MPGRPHIGARLVCWWVGCDPDYRAFAHMDHGGDAVPCARCGAADTSYEDRVGDTRHSRLVDWCRRMRWRLFDSWRCHPCPACGQRKCRPDCDGVPF
jgi:hypothetical protein